MDLATATVMTGLTLGALALIAGAGSPVTQDGRTCANRTPRDGAPRFDAIRPPSTLAKSFVLPSAAFGPSIDAAPSLDATASPPAVSTLTTLTIGQGTRVLVFGDSMTDAGFSQRLRALVERRGGVVINDGWTSSSTTTWAKGSRLPRLLARARPDVVFIVLGANEVALPHPESVAPAVRGIVSTVTAAAPTPCVWVGPAIWNGESGIVSVERTNAAPCAFFDSAALTIERARDGIHPTIAGGAAWADAVWSAHVASPRAASSVPM